MAEAERSVARGDHGVTAKFQSDPPNAQLDRTTVNEATTTGTDRSVHDIEKAAIRKRRLRLARTDPDSADYNGLALSGGGIRSASFCLGVIQALEAGKDFDKIDYLSTVSGGGYTGCCLTACMHKTDGDFPFVETASYADPAAVRHIRDYSNYLIPHGAVDVVAALGLIGRGLAANVVLVLPFFLLSVALLLFACPTMALDSPYHRFTAFVLHQTIVPHWALIPGFPITSMFLFVIFLFLVLWAFSKSFLTSDIYFARSATVPGTTSADWQGRFPRWWKWLLTVTLVIAWCELQPLVLNLFANPSPLIEACGKGNIPACVGALASKWLNVVTPALAPIAAVATFLSHQIASATRARDTSGKAGFVKQLTANALLWGVAIVVPSALWALYLLATLAAQGSSTSDGLHIAFYVLVFSVLAGALACFINPNATSLHRFYRDRLSKAFLFDPSSRDPQGDLEQYVPALHEIDPEFCPYPIVNAALNLEGSAFANQRGRNADFFEFTPEFSGSEATHYVGTKRLEEVEPKLDLGTAMAISGAAFSPNMGSATIKPLVPTLALLNVRLGFWMTNPRFAAKPRSTRQRFFDIRSFLLFNEIFGWINETSPTVYLTDGGNIENLGIQALLKRKCKLIIAVDAEADPSMTFGSFLKLERYARIDFGALIDLPWEAIRDRSLQVDADVAAGRSPSPGQGCHIAIGEIKYGPQEMGLLVYIKASLTGDEDDYVLDYKVRNPDFPHETTGDQFFGEEQLEVYRALGFHTVNRFLTQRSSFEVNARQDETQDAARVRLWTAFRAALS